MTRAGQVCFQGCFLPLVIDTLPDSVTNALNIVRLQLLQMGVTKRDEDMKDVMRPGSQPALTTSYRIRSLLFSAAE